MANTRSAVVETSLGHVTGVELGSTRVFRAIPYARPPVGELRWAPPVPMLTYEIAHDGTVAGFVAPQNPSRLRTIVGDIDAAQSEDCLTLTLHAPAAVSGKLPVLAWVHGGAWTAGGGDLPIYCGEKLAALGLIVVTINYRLGALGFLSHPAIGPGNLGLRDQICALEWIRKNIGAFGGDPDNVTLAGQSAGAWSIPVYVANARTTKLFHRAIAQSAPFGIGPLTPETAIRNAEYFLARLGVNPGQPDLLDQLRTIPVARILSAQQDTAVWYASSMPQPAVAAIAFQPVAEVGLVPAAADYGRLLLSARSGIDCIVGYTRDEMTAFAGESALGDPAAAAQCEMLFSRPALQWARTAARANRNVFVYRFDWSVPESGLGACHCLDLPFVFGSAASVATTRMIRGADRLSVERLSQRVRHAWASFARAGEPQGFGDCEWPRLDAPAGSGLIIDEKCSVADVDQWTTTAA